MVKAEAAAETERAELRAANRMLQQQVAALQVEIAKHKQGEAALRERADYAQHLFEHANDAIVTLTLEGGIVTAVNRGLEVLLGWTREELVGQHYRKFVTAAAVALIEERARRIAAGEKVSSIYEVDFVRKDGRVVLVEARSRFIRNWEGQPIGILAIHRDISARKETEEALRRNEQELADFFEHAPTGLHWVGPDGTILRVNQAELDLLGYTRQEYVGHHIAEFHADPLVSADILQRLTRGQTLDNYEARLRCKDGSLKTVLISSNVSWEGARFVHTRCFTRDITERKRVGEALRESEDRYRSLFENASDGIACLTADGTITSVNRGLEVMLGWSRTEMIGQSYQQFHTPSSLLAEEARIRRIRAGEKVSSIAKIELVHKEGRGIPVEARTRFIRNTAGQPIGVLAILRDITERQAAERLKDEFVSVVSHELRTPLTSIRGSLGLLASGMLGPIPDKGQRMLDIAVRNADRLVRLINDILDVERIQSGKVGMVKTSCNMADLMTRAVDEMRGMAEKAGVTLVVQPVQAQLWVDPDRILQTLTNLLSNAIKFSLAGTTVWLTAEPQGEWLLVQVKDHGRGIPADKLESIFERFQQVDASDSREKGGTGLGLAICRSIVQQHGGRIWAESTLGKGSVFSVMLPLPKEDRLVTPAARVNPSMTPGGEKDPTPVARDEQTPRLQVLVAEDDRDLARVLIALFERHGAVVYHAQTGTEAIQCCDFVVPDLLVLDPLMPEQDGFAVVDWMRQREPLCQMPVVVYAAGELTAAEQQQLTLGPTQFFTKSRVSPEQFEQKVMRWLVCLVKD